MGGKQLAFDSVTHGDADFTEHEREESEFECDGSAEEQDDCAASDEAHHDIQPATVDVPAPLTQCDPLPT
jgi:hypothetical protein